MRIRKILFFPLPCQQCHVFGLSRSPYSTFPGTEAHPAFPPDLPLLQALQPASQNSLPDFLLLYAFAAMQVSICCSFLVPPKFLFLLMIPSHGSVSRWEA